jgi:hypothetical protein
VLILLLQRAQSLNELGGNSLRKVLRAFLEHKAQMIDDITQAHYGVLVRRLENLQDGLDGWQLVLTFLT